jgi:proline iminopeptidase
VADFRNVSGWLEAGDGHRLWWEVAGEPAGAPAVMLHGGPGSGCAPWMRELFDLAAYRVVFVDQRGAGRSTPHASEATFDLSVVTTHHHIADLERLREQLAIDRWLVVGVSWGSTLGLAYAQTHPERVRALVLAPVTMTRRADVAWFTRGLGRFFPAEWRAFRDGVALEDRDGDLAAAYARRLASPDPQVRERAARDWCRWEETIVSPETGGQPDARFADARFRVGFARQVTHAFAHAAWLEEDQLLRNADRLAETPGVLVHGRLDLGAPLTTAWELAEAWPGSELVVVEGAGHRSGALGQEARRATDRLRTS